MPLVSLVIAAAVEPRRRLPKPRWLRVPGNWLSFVLGGALLMGLSSTQPQAQPGKTLERAALFGRGYIDAAEWGKANGCTTGWTSPKDEFQISSSRLRLKLNVDSKKAILNGVQIWLSAPVVVHRGSAWLAETDLRTLLHPILFPQPRERAVRTVVLDPGHGGKDRGKVSGQFEEKSIALALAKELKPLLEAEGFRVALTRNEDVGLELEDRPEIAKAKGGDLFVSLHFNSAGEAGPGIHGVEVYCMTPAGESSTNGTSDPAERVSAPGNRFDSQSVVMAYRIHQSLVQRLGMEDRGVRRARFVVLRDAHMPSILIEGGFLSNPREARLVSSAVHRRKMAEAIASGIKAYLDGTKPAAAEGSPKPKRKRPTTRRE